VSAATGRSGIRRARCPPQRDRDQQQDDLESDLRYFFKGKGKRGVNWEVLRNQKTASGVPIASIRITDKFRIRVIRDGVFMRFISLHPDHDSAYKARGDDEI